MCQSCLTTSVKVFMQMHLHFNQFNGAKYKGINESSQDCRKHELLVRKLREPLILHGAYFYFSQNTELKCFTQGSTEEWRAHAYVEGAYSFFFGHCQSSLGETRILIWKPLHTSFNKIKRLSKEHGSSSCHTPTHYLLLSLLTWYNLVYYILWTKLWQT